jgi:hypothetical protein
MCYDNVYYYSVYTILVKHTMRLDVHLSACCGHLHILELLKSPFFLYTIPPYTGQLCIHWEGVVHVCKVHRVVRRRCFFLDHRLTDGGKVVSRTHFCYRLSRPKGHSAAERIRSIENIHLIGTRSLDLPACSIVPQRTTLPRAPRCTCMLFM